VLCLQEVDSSDSFFQFLIGLGYDYRYRAKGLQGILIAYKTSVLRLVDSRIVDYDMLINGNVDKGQYSKGHGLLMLKVFNQVMQLETKSSRRLVIGNTHLYWDPQYEKVKYHQICSAVSQMYSFADQTDSVVLAGDLNSLPDSNVVRFVQFR
jgi:CCR4-NOT transcription complex subunit 6